MPLTVGEKLGPFTVLALIGAGGMGEVYRARDTKLDRDVAIKVLPSAVAQDPERLARFEREAKVLATLNHPNIAQIYGVEQGALVMELVEGEILPCPLPIETALPYAKQIAEALEYAHERGVMHRDLKPANIKVTPDGTVKLLDFGLAKAIEDPAPRSDDPSNSPTLTIGGTRIGVILGTAAYMSPEQANGKSADRRADIWSFGAVLYEMLAGKKAFDGESVSDTLASVLKIDPDWNGLPSSTPPAIRNLIRRCLTKDRKQRLQAIGEARIILGTPEEPSAATPQRTTRWLWPIAAAALLVALAALAFVHFREKPPENAVLRYHIALPEKSSVQSFAISPDGKYLAISATVSGKFQLYLRALDSLELRPMASTDGATFPFWSPDSRQIAFFANGKLKKVAVSGGPSQGLTDAPEMRGGSWGRDNVIAFTPTLDTNPLRQLPASGGQGTDIYKTIGVRRYPVFLPDGRHFLYMIGGAPERTGIYVGSLDGTEERRLLPDPSPPMFAPDPDGGRVGHLLFTRENNLMAQPFDSESRQLQGEAFPVASGLSLTSISAWMPASVSERGILVFQSAGSNANVRQIAWYDRSGKLLANVGSPGNVVSPSLSRDERKMLYLKGVGAGTEIWMRDLTRGTDSRLTSDSSATLGAVWSPNGDRIAYTSTHAGATLNLFQKPSDGTGQEESLLMSGDPKVPSQWSHDGQYLVYADTDAKSRRDLWVFPIGEAPSAGRKPKLFLKTEFEEAQGQISPDGHWMAYTSNSTGISEIFVQPFPLGEGKWQISTAGGTGARWRGDSKELYYVAADNMMMAVAVNASAGPKPSFEPGTPQPLFDSHMLTGNVIHQYDVSSDGKRFLINTVPESSSAPELTVVVNWRSANHAAP